MIPSATRDNVAYWATVEHSYTWVAEHDREMLDEVKRNYGIITEALGKKIAGRYSFARGLKGVATQGYGSILDIVNAIPVAPGQSLLDRVEAARLAVAEIRLRHPDHRADNPSGVTKWMWFRHPEDWYIYDRQSAKAVGAGEGSVRGMRTFFGILAACGVTSLKREIQALISDAGFDLRGERIVDKALWLLGGADDDGAISESRIERCRAWVADNPKLHELASHVQRVFLPNHFDLLRQAA